MSALYVFLFFYAKLGNRASCKLLTANTAQPPNSRNGRMLFFVHKTTKNSLLVLVYKHAKLEQLVWNYSTKFKIHWDVLNHEFLNIFYNGWSESKFNFFITFI